MNEFDMIEMGATARVAKEMIFGTNGRKKSPKEGISLLLTLVNDGYLEAANDIVMLYERGEKEYISDHNYQVCKMIISGEKTVLIG